MGRSCCQLVPSPYSAGTSCLADIRAWSKRARARVAAHTRAKRAHSPARHHGESPSPPAATCLSPLSRPRWCAEGRLAAGAARTCGPKGQVCVAYRASDCLASARRACADVSHSRVTFRPGRYLRVAVAQLFTFPYPHPAGLTAGPSGAFAGPLGASRGPAGRLVRVARSAWKDDSRCAADLAHQMHQPSRPSAPSQFALPGWAKRCARCARRRCAQHAARAPRLLRHTCLHPKLHLMFACVWWLWAVHTACLHWAAGHNPPLALSARTCNRPSPHPRDPRPPPPPPS